MQALRVPRRRGGSPLTPSPGSGSARSRGVRTRAQLLRGGEPGAARKRQGRRRPAPSGRRSIIWELETASRARMRERPRTVKDGPWNLAARLLVFPITLTFTRSSHRTCAGRAPTHSLRTSRSTSISETLADDGFQFLYLRHFLAELFLFPNL